MSVSEEDLDTHQLTSDDSDESEDDFDDEETIQLAKLQAASDMLKKSAVLFEYISDPDLCKNLSKRERTAIDKQLARIYALVEEVDVIIEENGEF